jgi:hypothetical protein
MFPWHIVRVLPYKYCVMLNVFMLHLFSISFPHLFDVVIYFQWDNVSNVIQIFLPS